MKLRKHHYIPVFYLKQWADGGGRLLKFSRPYGSEVKHEPTSPKKTGYEPGLYRVPNVPEHMAEVIEDIFMKKMDDLAYASLCDLIENNLDGWTIARKEAWSRFIVGLLLRNPENLERIKVEVGRYVTENYDAWKIEYEAIRTDADKPFTQLDALNIGKVTLYALQKFIENKWLLNNVSAITWGMVDVRGTKYRLVTSDRPVVRTNGLDKPDSHLAIPLSPTRLFIATNNDQMAATFQRMQPRDGHAHE
jgi:hypothetical protein